MPVGTCNGCGKEGQLTKEHLISLPIGRVIVQDAEVATAEMRRLLPTDNIRVKGDEEQRGDPMPDTRIDTYVEHLLCAECNQGWAIDLEEKVGPALYNFVHLHRPLEHTDDLKRWMAFFAVKGAFHYERTESLAVNGPYEAILGKLSNPDVVVEFPLLVARLDVNLRRWRFGYVADPLLGRWGVMLWVHFWGVLFVLAAPGAIRPLDLATVADGLRWADTTVVSKKDLHKVMPPQAIEALEKAKAANPEPFQ